MNKLSMIALATATSVMLATPALIHVGKEVEPEWS